MDCVYYLIENEVFLEEFVFPNEEEAIKFAEEREMVNYEVYECQVN